MRGIGRIVGAVVLGLCGAAPSAVAAVRLKDIARIDAGTELQLVGYGLVVGLDGTGDSRASTFTMQSVGNMLTRMGITVPDGRVRVKNAAAVMAVALLGHHHRKGSRLDVTVSSLGDAKSLEGGTLLYTQLGTPDGTVYVGAQGQISVGGFSVQSHGNRVSQNDVLVGRVPGGGLVEAEPAAEAPEAISIQLHDADFTTARRVATAINQELGSESAQALDAGTIVVQPPASAADSAAAPAQRVTLLARIEALAIEPDANARLVMNERTGTIVAGEHVTIASVAIAHGNLSVKIEAQPVVSQPPALSNGQTLLTQRVQVSADAEKAGLVPIKESANVGDLARALNALGVAPRDMIEIFQALKEAGALRAELRII